MNIYLMAVPVALLFASTIAFAAGGFVMADTYEKESREDDEKKVARIHAEGIAHATKIASVAFLLLGLAGTWIVINMFYMLHKILQSVS